MNPSSCWISCLSFFLRSATWSFNLRIIVTNLWNYLGCINKNQFLVLQVSWDFDMFSLCSVFFVFFFETALFFFPNNMYLNFSVIWYAHGFSSNTSKRRIHLSIIFKRTPLVTYMILKVTIIIYLHTSKFYRGRSRRRTTGIWRLTEATEDVGFFRCKAKRS